MKENIKAVKLMNDDGTEMEGSELSVPVSMLRPIIQSVYNRAYTRGFFFGFGTALTGAVVYYVLGG
jgi:hypothetical protein